MRCKNAPILGTRAKRDSRSAISVKPGFRDARFPRSALPANPFSVLTPAQIGAYDACRPVNKGVYAKVNWNPYVSWQGAPGFDAAYDCGCHGTQAAYPPYSAHAAYPSYPAQPAYPAYPSYPVHTSYPAYPQHAANPAYPAQAASQAYPVRDSLCAGGDSGEERLDERQRPDLRDNGGNPHVIDIEDAAEINTYFRRAIWTGRHLQVVLMSIEPGGSIGLEVHPNVDQFIRIEQGDALVQMGPARNRLTFVRRVSGDDAVMIPAGTWHNVTNIGPRPLKLYTIYAPPEHPFGTAQRTKAEAESAREPQADS